MTISSILRFVVRPPPRDLEIPPPRLSPRPPRPDPKPSAPSSACPLFEKPLAGFPYEPQPPALPSPERPPEVSSSAKVDAVEMGTSECVVKALVVLAGPLFPFPIGLAAVTPFDDGVASLFTVCVCPLCIAGLPHGSLSKLSREFFGMRLDFEGVLAGVISIDGVIVTSCVCFGDSSRFSEILDVLSFSMNGNDSCGSSGRCEISGKKNVTSSSGIAHFSAVRPHHLTLHPLFPAKDL